MLISSPRDHRVVEHRFRSPLWISPIRQINGTGHGIHRQKSGFDRADQMSEIDLKRKRCANLHTIFIDWILKKILFISPFVQAIQSVLAFLAVLRPLSLAYAPRKIVDRKALLRTNDGPFSLPFSPPTFAGLNGRKGAAGDVSYVSSSEHDSKAR